MRETWVDWLMCISVQRVQTPVRGLKQVQTKLWLQSATHVPRFPISTTQAQMNAETRLWCPGTYKNPTHLAQSHILRFPTSPVLQSQSRFSVTLSHISLLYPFGQSYISPSVLPVRVLRRNPLFVRLCCTSVLCRPISSTRPHTSARFRITSRCPKTHPPPHRALLPPARRPLHLRLSSHSQVCLVHYHPSPKPKAWTVCPCTPARCQHNEQLRVKRR